MYSADFVLKADLNLIAKTFVEKCFLKQSV